MLFNGTVRENIVLTEIEREEQISKMQNLLKRFNAKDENYEVKTNPANLSLGEQQKLFLIEHLCKKRVLFYLMNLQQI